MEHREQWWMTSLRSAESAVGLEIEKVRSSEVATAEHMEAQMVSLLGVLRTIQNRVECNSLAAWPLSTRAQIHSTGKDDGYQFGTEAMQQWHLVAETNESRAEVVRVKADADRRVQTSSLEQNARPANAEARAQNQALRA